MFTLGRLIVDNWWLWICSNWQFDPSWCILVLFICTLSPANAIVDALVKSISPCGAGFVSFNSSIGDTVKLLYNEH